MWTGQPPQRQVCIVDEVGYTFTASHRYIYLTIVFGTKDGGVKAAAEVVIGFDLGDNVEVFGEVLGEIGREARFELVLQTCA